MVLARYVESAPGLTDSERTGLLSDLSRRRRALWEEAKRLGGRLFEDEADDFVARVERVG